MEQGVIKEDKLLNMKGEYLQASVLANIERTIGSSHL